MNRYFFLILFCFITHMLYRQELNDTTTTKDITRNFIWVVPSNADNINGWAIGYGLETSAPISSAQVINGIHSNLQPIQLAIVALFTPHLLLSPIVIFKDIKEGSNFMNQNKLNLPINSASKTSYINGVSLYLFGLGMTDGYVTNGVAISTALMGGKKSNGISVGALANGHEEMNGVSIAGILNASGQVKGLQLGLINYAESLSGVQIGLLNRAGNRVIPFLNLGFGKKRRHTTTPKAHQDVP